MRSNADNSLSVLLLAFFAISSAIGLGHAQVSNAGETKDMPASPLSLYLFNRDGEFQEMYGPKLIAGWHWNVARIDDVGADLTPACRNPKENGEKCSWSLRTIKYQPVTRHFYAVTASGDRGGSNKDSLTYEFIGLFPDMRKHVAFDISTSGSMVPLISISQDGTRLIVLREERSTNNADASAPSQFALVADTYRTDRLWNKFEKQSSVRSTWRYTSSQLKHLSENGYFDAAGTIVYDGMSLITIAKDSLTLEAVDPLRQLSDEQKKKLAAFASKTTVQLPEAIRVLDSVEGRVLLGVEKETKDLQTIFTVDLAANTSTPAVIIPSGTAKLGRGNLILLQTSSGGAARATSSSFQVRNLQTGNLAFELNGGLEGLQVESYPLMCIPGDYLVYSAGSRVAALAMKAGARPSLIRTTLRLDEGTECIGVSTSAHTSEAE